MTLPARMSQLAANLQRAKDFVDEAAEVGVYLRLGKDGRWTYGTEDMEIFEDSEWAINPMSFSTGYSAFDDKNNRTGEVMASLSEEPVLRANLPAVVGAWSEQVGFEVKCMNTEDKDLEVCLYQRSKGGLAAVKPVLGEVMKRVAAGDENCVPVLKLGSDRYKHNSYGWIYFPVFTVVRWESISGLEEPKKLEQVDSGQSYEEKPAAGSEAEAVVKNAKPVDDEAKPISRRRRKTA